jgi:DNA-binding transcriptional LysR family regulator
MDPRRLLTFRAVAHARSFSRAAEGLSLTQPSVSHQVALLETELGVRLLDRGRGGLRLTQAGTVLLEHADEVAWRLELADEQLAELAGQRREHVRLGAFPTALAGYVPAAVARLRVAHGDLRVRLGEVTPSTLDRRLLSGEFDVAVSYQDATAERRELPGAERIDLMQDAFLLGLPPDHRLADEAGPISLAALADDDWIFASTDGFLAQACRDVGFDPHVVATTSEPFATRGLILRGLGVGWVPSLLVNDYDGVVVRPVAEKIRRRDIFALLPPGDRHPRARDVIDALTQTAPDFDPVPGSAAGRPERATT